MDGGGNHAVFLDGGLSIANDWHVVNRSVFEEGQEVQLCEFQKLLVDLNWL